LVQQFSSFFEKAGLLTLELFKIESTTDEGADDASEAKNKDLQSSSPEENQLGSGYFFLILPIPEKENGTVFFSFPGILFHRPSQRIKCFVY
jgi:hypothetical protein